MKPTTYRATRSTPQLALNLIHIYLHRDKNDHIIHTRYSKSRVLANCFPDGIVRDTPVHALVALLLAAHNPTMEGIRDDKLRVHL